MAITRKMSRDAKTRFDSLCDELIEDILTRLPPKEIYRSKCVSKRWRNLFSEISPLTRFLQQFRVTGFLYNKNYTKMDFFAFKKNPNEGGHRELKFSRHLEVVNSHKGLILCCENSKPLKGKLSLAPVRSFVYSPCTKQYETLPGLRHYNSCYHNQLIISYKEHSHHNIQQKYDVFKFVNRNSKLTVNKYSSCTGKWKVSEIVHCFGDFTVCDCFLLLDRYVYLWDTLRDFLSVYDIQKEKIRRVKLPMGPKSGWSAAFIGVSAGRLYYTLTTSTHFLVWALVDGARWSLTHSMERKRFTEPGIQNHLIYIDPVILHPTTPKAGFIEARYESRVVFDEFFLYHMETRTAEDRNHLISKLEFADPLIPYSLPVCFIS